MAVSKRSPEELADWDLEIEAEFQRVAGQTRAAGPRRRRQRLIGCPIAFMADVCRLTRGRAAAMVAVSAEVDAEFLRQIGSGTAISGSADPWADLKAAVAAVDLRGTSKPYWLSSPAALKALAVHHPAGGLQSFPTVALGGSSELLGIPVLPSDALAAGSMMLVDAASIAAGSTEVDLATSREADIQMDTAPTNSSATPTATSLVSMWQTNSVALRCECSLAVEVLRTGGIATITGATWGA